VAEQFADLALRADSSNCSDSDLEYSFGEKQYIDLTSQVLGLIQNTTTKKCSTRGTNIIPSNFQYSTTPKTC